MPNLATRRTARRTALALVAAALAAGCGHARKVPPPAPLPVDRPLIGLGIPKVDPPGFTGLRLEFPCRIENPNPFPLSVLRVTYRFTLEGRTAAQGTISAPLGIPAAVPAGPAVPGAALPEPRPGLGELTLPVTVRFGDVPSFAPLLKLDREAAWTLGGEVVFSTPAGPIAVPLSQEGRIALPRAPRFRAERAVVRASSPREVVVEVTLHVQNPNPYALPAGRVGVGLLLSDREVARADLVIAEPIPPGEGADEALPIKINIFKAGTAAARLLLPFTSLDVKLKGEAVFDGVPVPLDLSSSLMPR